MVHRRTTSAFGSVRAVLPYRISRFPVRTGGEGSQSNPQWHGSTVAEERSCECPADHSADAAPLSDSSEGNMPGTEAPITEFVEEGCIFALSSCIRPPGKERMSSDTSRRPTFGSSDVSVPRWRETQGPRVEVIKCIEDDYWNLSRDVAGATAEAWAPTGGTPPACYQLQAAGGCKTGLARPVLRDPSFSEALARRDALELHSELQGGVDSLGGGCCFAKASTLALGPDLDRLIRAHLSKFSITFSLQEGCRLYLARC